VALEKRKASARIAGKLSASKKVMASAKADAATAQISISGRRPKRSESQPIGNCTSRPPRMATESSTDRCRGVRPIPSI
jgi:hypothetical protein